MKNEVQVIDPKEFGLEEKQANNLTKGLTTILEERNVLVENYKEVMKLEITEENLGRFKALRLLVRDNRTKGINKWHTAAKNYFLTGGRFVDAIKNKEILQNEQMESKLMEAEKNFETLELERLAKIQAERVVLVSEYMENAAEIDLSSMQDDVWDAYLSAKKSNHLQKLAEEKRANEIKEAKIKEEKAEQDRIKAENEKLKKEAEEREKAENERLEKQAKKDKAGIARQDMLSQIDFNLDFLTCSSMSDKAWANFYDTQNKIYQSEQNRLSVEKLKIEREEKIERQQQEAKLKSEQAEKARLQKQIDDKAAEELKAKQDEEKRVQAQLKKGDAGKIKDLVNDLEAIKEKYQFKSKYNQKLGAEVDVLIGKIIAHINK